MKLTAFTNYCLRTLMFSAIRGDELSRVQDIVDAYGISRAHVVKCVHQLGQWGFLQNFRGRNGGFKLAKSASDISVGEVVRHSEFGMDIVECFVVGASDCPIIEVCKLSDSFRQALKAFTEVLDGVTIADVTSNPEELQDRLKLGPRDVFKM